MLMLLTTSRHLGHQKLNIPLPVPVEMVKYLNTACGALINFPLYAFRRSPTTEHHIPLLGIIFKPLLTCSHLNPENWVYAVAISLNHPMFLKVSTVKAGIGIDHICMQLRVCNPSVFTLIYQRISFSH